MSLEQSDTVSSSDSFYMLLFFKMGERDEGKRVEMWARISIINYVRNYIKIFRTIRNDIP